jgi:hypothetical protein
MPFVEAKLQGGKQKPTAIILRPSNTRSFDGAALAIAERWHQAPTFWSAGHYTVDDLKRYRCVPDDIVAGSGDDVDKGAIRIAVCAEPVGGEVFWNEDHHRLVLRRTAELVAELSLIYKIPVEYLNEDQAGSKTYAKWKKRRTRRRGGIYVVETSGFPFTDFINEINAKRDLKKHI